MEHIVLVAFLLMLILGIVSIFLHNDLLNPLTCFLIPISAGYVLYYKLYRAEYKVTDCTLICFCFGAICFLTGYLLFVYFLKNRIAVRENLIIKNREIIWLYELIIGLGFIINCIIFYRNGISGPFGSNFLRNVRWNSLYSGRNSLLGTYSTVFLHVTVCIFLQQRTSAKTWKKVYFIILLMISSLFTMARTAMLQYAISIIYICYFLKGQRGIQKRVVTAKHLIFGIGEIIVFFLTAFIAFSAVASVTAKLGGNSIFDKEFYLYKYIGYPIVAFDLNVREFPMISMGYYSLGPVGKILGILGVYNVSDFSGLGVASNTQFNVYSYIVAPYKDFGFVGVIFISLILGLLCGMFYWMSVRKKGEWTIFYSIFVYSILMAFYAYQFAMTYYIYVAAILVLYACIRFKQNGIVMRKTNKFYEKKKIKI